MSYIKNCGPFTLLHNLLGRLQKNWDSICITYYFLSSCYVAKLHRFPLNAGKNVVGSHLWRRKIALPNILIVIIHMLGPKVPELIHTNIQPGLHVTVEMNNSCIPDLLHADAWIVPESKNMPGFVQWLCG
jgi:hypothetical protein